MSLRTIVLGAAAGGGLPQWNCGCENCNLARSGDIPAQTQSSLAVSPDGQNWAILNASPDIRTQLGNSPLLFPTGLREVPIQSVLVTNGDIDHVAGLLTLREMQPFTLFATQSIQDVIAQNPIFDALNAAVVKRAPISLDEPFKLVPGLKATLFPVPGKVPLYLEEEHVQTDLVGEQTVGVALRTQGKTAYYIPGCAALTSELRTRLEGADLLFFDGTLWKDDEMVRAGLGQKTGKRMGHMSMSGPDGSIAGFADMQIGRKVFVHLNNTNPVLRPNSTENAKAQSKGWTIGQDGMEISL